jgi:hypothetical protein
MAGEWLERIIGHFETVVKHNEKQETQAREHVFYVSEVPSITVRDYILRIHKFLEPSPSCWLAVGVYVTRMLKRTPDITLNPLTIYHIILGYTSLALKFLHDQTVESDFFCKVGGISSEIVYELELECFRTIDYNASVTMAELHESMQAFGMQDASFLTAANTTYDIVE